MKTPAIIIGLRPLKHATITQAVAATCKLLPLIFAATMTHAQPVTNFVTGALWRETWFNIPGNQVSDLPSDWGFPKLSSLTCSKKRLLLYGLKELQNSAGSTRWRQLQCRRSKRKAV